MNKTAFLVPLFLLGFLQIKAQVGIGTKSPNPSAKLDVTSPNNNKGFLLPGMTSTARDALAGATSGLFIYNTTTNALQFSNGTNWVDLSDNTTTPISGTEPVGHGDVGIGTETPNIHAIVEVASISQGFLPPRMTTDQRNALPSPAAGLLIYNLYNQSIEFSNGTNWINLRDNSTLAPVNATPASVDGNVGIGTTTPNASAQLDLSATDKGFLPPRMTTSQRDAIVTPAEGLIIYNTTANCLEWFIGIGWQNACNGSTSPPQASFCQNDIVSNTDTSAPIVAMKYDYNGDGIALYNWCAREIDAPADGGTGKWLDRNLGAYRVPVSSTDAEGYGDLYQWGRAMDGHQKRVQRSGFATEEGNATQGEMVNVVWNNANNTSDTPNDVRFIEGDDNPTTQNFDWVDNNNDNRWAIGANDPCPSGYSVPTAADLTALSAPFTPSDFAGAFASALKLPNPGYRSQANVVELQFVGERSFYWSRTIDGTNSSRLYFDNDGNNLIGASVRALGAAVRCIRNP